LSNDKKNAEAAAALKADGVTLYDWSAEDRAAFRSRAQGAWDTFADTPEAKALVASHRAYLRDLGLITD
jgi:broad specificity phosphatase PhoE